MPTLRRSVSQIAADLEALAQPSPDSNATPPGIPLEKEKEKEKGVRRVTMPLVYSQPGLGRGGYTIPAVQPRRASIQVKTPGEYPFPSPPDMGVASPTPKRPVRLSTMGFELGDQ
jgi:hypothetical protein